VECFIVSTPERLVSIRQSDLPEINMVDHSKHKARGWIELLAHRVVNHKGSERDQFRAKWDDGKGGTITDGPDEWHGINCFQAPQELRSYAAAFGWKLVSPRFLKQQEQEQEQPARAKRPLKENAERAEMKRTHVDELIFEESSQGDAPASPQVRLHRHATPQTQRRPPMAPARNVLSAPNTPFRPLDKTAAARSPAAPAPVPVPAAAPPKTVKLNLASALPPAPTCIYRAPYNDLNACTDGANHRRAFACIMGCVYSCARSHIRALALGPDSHGALKSLARNGIKTAHVPVGFDDALAALERTYTFCGCAGCPADCSLVE
jgi:hypothetical protein